MVALIPLPCSFMLVPSQITVSVPALAAEFSFITIVVESILIHPLSEVTFT